MGQVTLTQQLDDSFANLTGQAVIQRAFLELARISRLLIDDDVNKVDVIKQLDDVVKFSVTVETGFSHVKAFALKIIKDNWEALPLYWRLQYSNQFYVYARSTTGKERSTIDNWMRIAQVWYGEDAVRPAGTVEVVKRDAEQRPVRNSDGSVVKDSVEFNPIAVDSSKLLILAARAANGEMTDKLWEMLADPVYTCDDIRMEHLRETSPTNGKTYDLQYKIIGPGLYMQIGPKTFCIAEELNWEEYNNSDEYRELFNKFLARLSISSDEDVIYGLERQA